MSTASETAIAVLRHEIKLLTNAIQGGHTATQGIQKSGADALAQIEKEMNQMLARAGVLNDYNAFQKKKSEARRKMDADLALVRKRIEDTQRIVDYLAMRVQHMENELREG